MICGVKFRPIIFVTIEAVSFGSDTSVTASQLASASSPTWALTSDVVANRTVLATLNFKVLEAYVSPSSPAAPYSSSWAMAQIFFPWPPFFR